MNSEFIKVSEVLGVGWRALRGKWSEIPTGAKHLRFLIHLLRMWPCVHLQAEWTKSIACLQGYGATRKVVPWQLRHLVTMILDHGPCDVFTASWERAPTGIWKAKPPKTICIVSCTRAEVGRRPSRRPDLAESEHSESDSDSESETDSQYSSEPGSFDSVFDSC
jgi:hypothetical protein